MSVRGASEMKASFRPNDPTSNEDPILSIAALTKAWGTRTLAASPPAAPYTCLLPLLLLCRHPPLPLARPLRPWCAPRRLPACLHSQLSVCSSCICPPAELPQPCLGSSPRVRIPQARLREAPLTRAAELKETHLAPLANTFSRSSSTSTIVDDQPTPKASSSAASATTLGNSKDNGIGTCDPLPALTAC